MKRCVICRGIVWPWQDKGFCKAKFDGEVREIQWHRLVHGSTLPLEWLEWMKGSDDGICIEMQA